MTLSRKQRGLAICLAIAVFLFARGISVRLDEVSNTADTAAAEADEAKSAASEASDAASSAQETADEANDKANRLCNYGC